MSADSIHGLHAVVKRWAAVRGNPESARELRLGQELLFGRGANNAPIGSRRYIAHWRSDHTTQLEAGRACATHPALRGVEFLQSVADLSVGHRFSAFSLTQT